MNNETKPSILIVDDERNTRDVLGRMMRRDFDVTLAADGTEAVNLIQRRNFDIVMTDLQMPGGGGMSVLHATREKVPSPPCIVLTAYGSIETAVNAVKGGAADFITKPVNFDHLKIKIDQLLESGRLREENKELREKISEDTSEPKIIANSTAMSEVLNMVKQIAPSRSTVLITGESGTGKEVIANELHRLSGRSGRIIPVHCAALPPNLLESELFGHEAGAFTGAIESRKGRFELADGGTLFLDEIGEIDPQIQVKLLRVLETRCFERVGGVEPISVDVRLISATNRNLTAMVREGTFREDLFFRLDVVTVDMPPLRKREGDIPLLVKIFIDEFAADNARGEMVITPEAVELLCGYAWPGNIRELRNCIERMVVLCRKNELTVKDLPSSIRNPASIVKSSKVPVVEVVEASPADSAPDLNLDHNEKHLIQQALDECDGNRTKAAQKLGISRRTLHRKLNQFDIQ
jgi:two-component system, NtrC family, response regulator AtoC